MRWFHKISWALYTFSLDVGLSVTIAFWAILRTEFDAFSWHCHAINSVALITDLIVSGKFNLSWPIQNRKFSNQHSNTLFFRHADPNFAYMLYFCLGPWLHFIHIPVVQVHRVHLHL